MQGPYFARVPQANPDNPYAQAGDDEDDNDNSTPAPIDDMEWALQLNIGSMKPLGEDYVQQGDQASGSDQDID